MGSDPQTWLKFASWQSWVPKNADFDYTNVPRGAVCPENFYEQNSNIGLFWHEVHWYF